MTRKIVYIVLAVVAMAAVYGIYQYNKPHRDIKGEAASLQVEAAKLFDDFVTDEPAANQKYLDNVIEVSGTVASTDTDENGNPMIVLKTNDDFFGVNCYFDRSVDVSAVKEGDQITVKGQCTGYTMDVNLIKCTLKQ